jgi:hypothetical protein
MTYPVRGQKYTLAEVEKLQLRDSAFLMLTLVKPGSSEGYLDQYPIQTSHFHMDDLLKIPEWAGSRWKYMYETTEWIPVFYCVSEDEELVKGLVDVEKLHDYDGWWVVPKAFPRPQYEDS